MKNILIVLGFLMSFQVAQAHEMDDSELNESQIRIMQVQEDLAQSFERATLLQNSIISKEIDQSKKCAYLSELETLIRKLDFTINEYSNLKGDRMTTAFFDQEGDLRKLHAAQLENQLISMEKSVDIFKSNLNHCQ